MNRRIVALAFAVGLLFWVAGCVETVTPTISSPGTQAKTAPAAGIDREWNALVAAAQKEGKVMFYRSAAVSQSELRDAVTRAFKEKYGIEVEFTTAPTGELVARLDRENRGGLNLADVGMFADPPIITSIKPLGITEPLEPLLILPEVTDSSKWHGGKIPYMDVDKHGLSPVWFVSPPLTINTEMVKPGEIKSYDDILAPKWKGQIVLDDPTTFGLGANWFGFMLRSVMGKEKGLAFMRAFAKQEPIIIRDRRQQIEWVARGKYPMTIGTSQDAVNTFIAMGAPVSQPRVKEPFFAVFGSTDVIAFKRASHPNAKKLFVNWILSKDGASIISRTYGAASTRIDVSLEGVNPSLIPTPQDILLDEDFYKEQGDYLKLAGEVFGALLK